MSTFITLNRENIADQHICCAITDSKSNKSNVGVEAKKEWLCARMQEGLKFVKLDARGKVFIEYLPAQHAWMPVNAPNYLLINCLWVSGSFKGKGYGKQLLDICEQDAKGMNGVVLVVGNKKKPFLSDKSFFSQYGYEVYDTAAPYFELLVKRMNPKAPLPSFTPCAKLGMPKDIKGVDIFYTAQCPFTIPYIDMLKPVINASNVPVRTHQITTKEEAQNHFCPITTYSIFVNGQFYSNEIHTAAKLEKLLSGYH